MMQKLAGAYNKETFKIAMYMIISTLLYWLNFKSLSSLKFMFSKKATKIDEIFTVGLTFTT